MALNVFGTPSNMTYSGSGTSGDPYVIESTNHSVNTTAEIIFQATESGTIFPNLTVDSEIASDVAGLFRNTIPIWQASGQDNFSTSFRVSTNDQVKVNYIKDGAGAFGDDNVTGTVYFVPDPPEPLPEVAIVMVTQPVSSLSGNALSTQPSVKIVDVNGDIVPGTLISVTVGAVAVSGAAVASGTLTVEPVSGNVVFTDLVVTGYGSYYLSFTAAGLTPASSNTITFVQDPGNPNPPIPVKPKRSYIPSSIPTSGDMETNEFAINVTDKKGYVKDSNGIVHLVFDGNPSASGVSSIIAGTGVSVDTATGDVTVTNSEPDQVVTLTDGTAISVTGAYPDFTIANDAPDQTVTLTDGTGISVTGTYPDFTITNSLPDQTVSLTEGTDITITGTYPDFTIGYSGVAGGVTSIIAGTGISVDVSTGDVTVTNDAPDQIVSLADGTGISVTGTYPSFTIDSNITQYTDSDARLSLSAGTGISYDNTTGIITNDAPDQTVSLTGGTDISVTGTYPDFTVDFDGSIPTNADPDTAGIIYGLTTDNLSGYNVSLGFGANGTLTTGIANIAIGGASGDMTSGSYNVAIGFDCNVADPTADKQLAIGPDAYVRWITGDSSMNIKPGAGIKDSLNSLGTSGQILSSTGTAIEWIGAGVSSITAGTGISVDVSTGAVTVTNSSPDQTVSLTNGTGISVTGTYPSFTIATTITQYTDTDARKSISSTATGLTYTNTTGVFSTTFGYGIPTTASQTNWDTAYTNRITSLTTTGSGAATLTSNVLNIPTPSASTFTSLTVTGSSGASTLLSGVLNVPTYTLSGLGGIKLTDLSSSATGLTYTNTTGAFSLTSGYSIPTTAKQGNWDTAYSSYLQWDGGSTSLVAATGRTSLGATTVGTNLFTLTNPSAVTFPRFNLDNTVSALDAATFRGAIGAGTSSATGTVTSVAITVPTGLSVTGTPITASGTLAVTLTAGYSIPTTSSQTTWDTAYTNRITSLTTTGSSGAATLTSNTLNIPTYTLAGLGGIKLADLSSTATGLTYTNTTGVFSATSGYAIPTTASQTNWDSAYTQRLQWDGGSTNLVAATGRTSLGLVIGTNVQAWDADLDAISALVGTTGLLKKTAANTWSLDTSTYLTANQTITLSGDVSGSGTTAITTTLATVSIAKGGTGQTTANAAVNALLPSQTSNSGKYLTTDGTNSSWGTVSSGTSIPSASMQMFAGAITQSASAGVVTTTAPTGWLLCNGDAVSRVTYSALWTALGTTSSPFGQGDGSTTFNLPDPRGRVPVSVGTGSGLTARTLGGTVGTENETLASSQIPAHSHPNTVGSTAGGTNNITSGMSANTVHNHSVDRAAWTNNGSAPYTFTGGSSNIALQNIGINNSSSLDHSHNLFITNANNTGGGGSHNNMQPSIGFNFIIKT